MSREAREFYDKEFVPQFNRLLDEIRKTPLSILVWGPGVSGGDVYEKRLQIRGHLRELGHAAIFSEELKPKLTHDCHAQLTFSSNVIELCQAIPAEFIVVIHSSPGSIAEIHDFGEQVGSKMFIFIDERYQDGYSYTGLLRELALRYNNVETYQYPADIENCHLLGAVERKVQELQVAKWRTRRR